MSRRTSKQMVLFEIKKEYYGSSRKNSLAQIYVCYKAIARALENNGRACGDMNLMTKFTEPIGKRNKIENRKQK
jgi:hypothetical protein